MDNGYAGSMRLLTREQAKANYRTAHWQRARADLYDGAIGFQLFDAAVIQGVGQAVRFLQRAVRVAVTAAADAPGLSDKTEAAIKQAIGAASTKDLYKLKTADQQFAVERQRIGYQTTRALERIAVDDQASARNREVTLAAWPPRVLAALVAMEFFGAILLMALVSTTESREPLRVLVGSLGTSWTSVTSYYFGSTAGGHEKFELLARSEING